MDFTSKLKKIAADAERVLDQMLPGESELADFARYAALDAGKRLRTFMTVQTAGLFDADYESAIRIGACIEMIHNFSLIHDDLPCIDNDALRRGRPSVWAKFGESNAILAGDFLLNRAYKILVADEKIPAALKLRLIEILADATDKMLLGEWMDIKAETGMFQTALEIDKIQSLKTGAIFWACVKSGALLGDADNAQIAALEKFTQAMGLCFQITDDILDAAGDQEKVGKTLHKDSAAGKATYVSLLGLDGARDKVAELAGEAIAALGIFDSRADGLRELMKYMVGRES